MSVADFKPETWTVSSNEALKVSLVGDNAIQFHPTFTYPIYGDSEQIFGYKDLVIHLAFDSVTLKPFLNVKYSAKRDEDADDVEQKLLAVLPKDDVVVKDEARWVDLFEAERKQYSLPDISCKVSEYTIGNEEFEVYKVNILDPDTKRLHRRIQIFALLLIEAASYIDENDGKWDIFWCFSKKTRQCIGYVTTYKYWKFNGSKEFDQEPLVKYRGKISQFVVLPPYQGKRHGSHIYNAIVNAWLSDDSIQEITVEDPNENFDDLRDRNDLERVYNAGFFEELANNEKPGMAWFEERKQELKLETRQFHRILEMIYLYNGSSQFPIEVKRRLYGKNIDALAEMEEDEKKEALHKSFIMVKDDYKRILAACTSFLKRKIKKQEAGPSAKKLKSK